MNRPQRLGPGDVVGERFRLTAEIGEGGMGRVYEAVDERFERQAAVKLISRRLASDVEFRARFTREAEAAERANHPHILPVWAHGEEGGHLYLATPLCDTDLAALVADEGRLSLAQTLRLLGQIAWALDWAHHRGVVHRDVKPENILLVTGGGEEHAYLADFGMARVASAATLTQYGQAVGLSPAYAAPEQWEGGEVTAATDQYALAATLHACVAGQPPFGRLSITELRQAHLQKPPPPVPVLADAINVALAKGLAKDPADRYGSCQELIGAVRAAADSQTGPDVRPGATAQPGQPPAEPTVLAGPTTPPAATAPPAAAPPPAVAQPAPVAAAPTTPPVVPPAAAPEVPAVAAAAAAVSPPDPPRPPGPPNPRGAGPPNRDRPPRKRRGVAVLLLVAVAAIIVAGVVLLTGGKDTPSTPAVVLPTALSKLLPVPYNRVKGKGTVKILLRGNRADITLKGSGLLSGAHHLMHIHAGGAGTCPDKTAAKHHPPGPDGNLAIDTKDGASFYGPVVVSLTETGPTTTEGSILAFRRYPIANVSGLLTYRRTIVLQAQTAAAIRDDNAVIVTHGIDYNDNGTYDSSLGTSELNNAIDAESTAPALCGPLRLQKKATSTTASVVTAKLTTMAALPAGQDMDMSGMDHDMASMGH